MSRPKCEACGCTINPGEDHSRCGYPQESETMSVGKNPKPPESPPPPDMLQSKNLSTKKKYRIIREYDDHEPVILGIVSPSYSRQSRYTIVLLWEDFQKTEPDCDTDFIDFLCQNGFEKIDDDDQVNVFLS